MVLVRPVAIIITATLIVITEGKILEPNHVGVGDGDAWSRISGWGGDKKNLPWQWMQETLHKFILKGLNDMSYWRVL
jgi:hypothetical protein